jgi:hypothetical protein
MTDEPHATRRGWLKTGIEPAIRILRLDVAQEPDRDFPVVGLGFATDYGVGCTVEWARGRGRPRDSNTVERRGGNMEVGPEKHLKCFG